MLLKPDMLIDTARLNAETQANIDNPYRDLVGVAHIPIEVPYGSPRFKEMMREKCDVFVAMMSKQGWELDSRPRIGNPVKATDPDGKDIEGEVEYEIKARFKKQGAMRLWRVELDPAVVRWEEDQEISVADARKAWGF